MVSVWKKLPCLYSASKDHYHLDLLILSASDVGGWFVLRGMTVGPSPEIHYSAFSIKKLQSLTSIVCFYVLTVSARDASSSVCTPRSRTGAYARRRQLQHHLWMARLHCGSTESYHNQQTRLFGTDYCT
jgi:hypothetical protein